MSLALGLGGRVDRDRVGEIQAQPPCIEVEVGVRQPLSVVSVTIKKPFTG
jgi:hypothetical protein